MGLKKTLIELLNIHGTSGNELHVRDYIEAYLEPLMPTKVDAYGNLLAMKKYGTGKGATILLSAHMDTVRGVRDDKKIVEKNGIFTAILPDGNRGVLGADDRAGISIILNVIEHLDKINFNGTIKVAFSREEEIGCIGASKIDKKFYKDVNLAIVVDRRGSRDIVVGCTEAFCSDAVGEFMENASKVAEMDYKCVEGGISDACTFSENGINSVNLSAGYQNEHTVNEYVSIAHMRDTVRFMLQAIGIINTFYKGFGKVPRKNKWVNNVSWKSAQLFDDELLSYEEDENGDIYYYIEGDSIVLEQNGETIKVSKDNVENLFENLHFLLTKELQ